MKTSWYHKDQLSEEELEQAMIDAVIKEDSESEAEEQPMISYPKAGRQSGSASFEVKVNEMEKAVLGMAKSLQGLKRPEEQPETRAVVPKLMAGRHATVTVPESLLKSAADSLSHSEQILRQAATMSMAASSAYTSEASVMGAARDKILGALDTN